MKVVNHRQKRFMKLGMGCHDIQQDVGKEFIIKQVAWNESSLILKIILQNTQTLQKFTKIIKTESIYKSY